MLTVNLQLGVTGNCISQEEATTNSKICPLKCLSTLRDEEAPLEEEIDELPDLPSAQALSLYVKNIVVYMSGFVGTSIAKRSTCATCVIALMEDEPELADTCEEYILINEKNNGGLLLPSKDLIQVCKFTEGEILRVTSEGLESVKSAGIINKVSRQCTKAAVFSKLRLVKNSDHPLWSDHVVKLIGSIAQEYVKIRFHHMSREATLASCPTTNRSKNTKAIHFSGN
jgi:hypothetical protein